MDLLSSLINQKKESSKPKTTKKFVTRGELEQASVASVNPARTTKRKADDVAESAPSKKSDSPPGKEQLPRSVVMERLRARGKPVTLFAESDEDRFKRLTHLEETENDVDGMALQGSYAMRNTFLDNRDFRKKKKVDPEDAPAAKESASSTAREAKVSEPQAEVKEGEGSEVKKSTSKEKHIYRFIKKMLNEWEEELALRPEEEKRRAQAKLDTKTFKQCKDYIKPFMKKLKTKSVEGSILYHVDKIVTLCEERHYIKAADWYVRLAIGNSPWPIGVTMVGIHERSGRERIESSKVAHVMNDEEQRKYITSMKRIMTFCQKKYPTDHSKMLL